MDSDPEAELAALIRAAAYDRAATLAFEKYGAELYGFLVNHFGAEAAAGDVFGQLAEDAWRGLPAFEFRCTVRTWLYVLARNASSRYRRAPWNQRRSGESALDQAIAKTRTETAPWLQTEVKDRWRALREALDPDDRSLLVLRIDRELPWEDCARITLEDEAADDAAIARESARLRKRFQVLKDDLRDRAKAAGLLEDSRG